MSQTKSWLEEVEVMRGISIIAVLLIHVSGRPLAVLAKDSHSFGAYLTLNTLAQFAVPSFIFLSALVLSYGLRKQKNIDWSLFYSKRIRQVLIPYFIWSIIYLIYRYLEYGYLDLDNSTNWRNWILFGKSYFHLYYLSVVIQLYLFFPLLYYLFRWRSWSFGSWLGLGIILQLVFYWINRLYVYSHLPFPGSFLYWYIPLVFSGLWLGENLELWYSRWPRYRLPVALAIIPGGYLFLQFTFALEIYKAEINTFLYQIWWYLYVTGLTLLELQAARILANQVSRIKKTLVTLGQHSFGIYLVHVMFLNYWNAQGQTGNLSLFHLLFGLGFLTVLAASWLFSAAIGATPLGIPLFGGTKVKKPARN